MEASTGNAQLGLPLEPYQQDRFKECLWMPPSLTSEHVTHGRPYGRSHVASPASRQRFPATLDRQSKSDVELWGCGEKLRWPRPWLGANIANKVRGVQLDG